MLVLSRKVGERIVINADIEIVVLAINGNKIRLGLIAPPTVPIVRKELAERGAAATPPAAELPTAAGT